MLHFIVITPTFPKSDPLPVCRLRFLGVPHNYPIHLAKDPDGANCSPDNGKSPAAVAMAQEQERQKNKLQY
jgi:hypothetical protein